MVKPNTFILQIRLGWREVKFKVKEQAPGKKTEPDSGFLIPRSVSFLLLNNWIKVKFEAL